MSEKIHDILEAQTDFQNLRRGLTKPAQVKALDVVGWMTAAAALLGRVYDTFYDYRDILRTAQLADMETLQDIMEAIRRYGTERKRVDAARVFVRELGDVVSPHSVWTDPTAAARDVRESILNPDGDQ